MTNRHIARKFVFIVFDLADFTMTHISAAVTCYQLKC